MSDAWGKICDYGRFSMIVLTRACIMRHGLARNLHPDARYLGVLLPDGASESFPVGFLTLDDLTMFCQEMGPHRVEVAVAPGEDAAALRAVVLLEKVPATVLDALAPAMRRD